MLTIVVNSPVFAAPYFAIISGASVGDTITYFTSRYPHCTFAFEDAPIINQCGETVVISSDPILKVDKSSECE